MRSGAKSYMRKYLRKCINIFTIYEEAVSHTGYDFAPDPSKFPNICMRKMFYYFLSVHIERRILCAGRQWVLRRGNRR
jgi:hypothetical protein